MKLFEATNQQQGHWDVKEDAGVRHWTPIYDSSDPDPFLPFINSGFAKKNKQQYSVTAYDLLPGTALNSLPEGQKEEFLKLLNALKQRSPHDVIEPRVFSTLLEKCARLVIAKSGLRGQNPRRMVIVTPGSSSPVAEQFARLIQQALKVPQEHTFFGHFTKRDVDDFHLDVMDNPKLGEKARKAIGQRLRNMPGDKAIQAKMMQQGDRDEARRAGTHMLQVDKDIKLAEQMVPYLIVVDDNKQGGTTYKSVGELFKQHTGVTPGTIINMSMFKI